MSLVFLDSHRTKQKYIGIKLKKISVSANILTTATENSSPSEAQLITSVSTPSKQTLKERKRLLITTEIHTQYEKMVFTVMCLQRKKKSDTFLNSTKWLSFESFNGGTIQMSV